MALHQRSNPYNKHLPFAGDVDSDADKFIAEIKDRLGEAIRKNDLRGGASKWLFNLHKYVLLYGLRFSKEDHVWFARVAYEVFTTEGMDPVTLESIAKLMVSLLKKKYLLPREDLILDWKPLYELYHFWEDSSAAIRNMAKPTTEFKKNLQMLIRYSRSYFSDEATREMLNKWRPLLCPFDTSLETAMRYLMLFLPTSRHIPAEHTYELWLDEFLTLWQSFSNRPTWEVNLFYLLSRLAFHNTGRVDWSPHLESIFTHIMISLNVPVTYGGSGIKLKFGLSAVNDYATITRFIVSVMEGGSGLVQKYLSRMFLAIESYYHPANSGNSAAENLHHFVSMLCYNYVHRVFLERHNKKYPCRIPEKSRLTDDDIDAFVRSVKPIAFHLLYNPFEDDRRTVFNILATLRPELIVPPLLEKLNSAFDTLTQPHRFTACIATVSSCSRVLVERYPAEAVDVLLMLLPGIDLNDIWKCAENFIVISDVFEVIWLVDFSNPESWAPGANPTPEERAVLAKTAMLEDFALELTDKIMTLVENSSRINTRAENDATDDALNDEEIAVDAAVADAFHKMVFRCSPKIFERIFKKVREYVRGKIMEAAVAGTILAGMCKAVVSVSPTMCLDFFVSHLSDRIMTALQDKGDSKKADIELTFSLLLLSEVCSIRGVNFYPTECPLLPYMDKICAVLDATRGLINKEEYEYANQLLQNTLFNLTHTRPLSRPLTQTEQPLLWSREVFAWGKTTGLESLEVSWYVPSEEEVAAAQRLLDRYLTPAVESLEALVARKVEMKKEEVLKNLRIVYRALHGSTDLVGRIPTDKKLMSLAADSMQSMERMQLKFRGENVRLAIQRLMHGVQTHLLSHSPDDVESLNALIVLMDVLLMSFGLDEDDLYDHVDEYRVIKQHRLNRLVQGKHHFPSVLVERIQIQHETYVWMKYALTEESLPVDLLADLVELGISHYSDVRIYAQELLAKIIARTSPHSLRLILPRMIECLHKSPSVTHQMQKGALYILTGERFGFFYEWEFCARLMPVLVESQHSDKQSIDELLNSISYKVNRHYSDFGLYTLPIRKTRPSARLMQLVNDVDAEMGVEDVSASPAEVNEHFLELEKKMYELVSRKTLHWRHYSMGMGIMLLLVTHDRVPAPEAVEMWLKAMVHDDRSIRHMAFQALECIMKVSRRERRKTEKSIVPPTAAGSGMLRPGLREDNEFMQYRTMNGDELRDYWADPFSVKGYQGFYVWDEPAKLRVVDPGGTEDRFKDKYVDDLIAKYFSDQSYVDKVVEFNTTEHSKGEDEFSMDKALFFSYLFENFGDRFQKVLMPHLRRLSASGEESKQRFAAELCYGAIRGSRFWDYGVVAKLWAEDLEPTLKNALEKVSTETLADWGQCINGASNKCDPNRIRWMVEALLGASVPGGTLGAFREYATLRLLHKAIMHNWKLAEVFNRAYEALKSCWDHPYNKVRIQIAKTMDCLMAFDVEHGAEKWNMGGSYPTRARAVDDLIKKLSLNMENPVLNGLQVKRQTNNSESSSAMVNGDVSTEEESMDVDDSIGDSSTGSGGGGGDEEDEDAAASQSDRTLKTAAMWITNTIKSSSATLRTDLFRLMPFLCQYIGTEHDDKDPSQHCLMALCYLSVSYVPKTVIPEVYDVLLKLKESPSYKTKVSMLEFLQVFVYTNFLQICGNDDFVRETESIVLGTLADENVQVRQKSARILSGLAHSYFLSEPDQLRLIQVFRSRIRRKMKKSLKSKSPAKRRFVHEDIAGDKEKLLERHSGVLGLCAFVTAFPYDVPSFVPDILVELERHLHDPQPIPKTIKETLQEFKRTHQDNWTEHKQKFTEDQLVVMTDLLVSQNYYA